MCRPCTAGSCCARPWPGSGPASRCLSPSPACTSSRRRSSSTARWRCALPAARRGSRPCWCPPRPTARACPRRPRLDLPKGLLQCPRPLRAERSPPSVSFPLKVRASGVMRSYLDFEKPVAELEAKLEELRALGANHDAVAISDDIGRLGAKASAALEELYATLSPWQKTLVARHPERPHFLAYCNALIDEFTPLAGDRKFGEDEAIVGGFGRFRGAPVCVIGQEKGDSTETRIRHNFGMARPEGYRKAARLMELADRFEVPVLTFVDTAGAYPGIAAEERGQAEAMARSAVDCLALGAPNVSIGGGEG